MKKDFDFEQSEGPPDEADDVAAGTDHTTFVIKVWVEADDVTTWGGHITHAISGERRHLKDLRGIRQFISSYLQARQEGEGIERVKRLPKSRASRAGG